LSEDDDGKAIFSGKTSLEHSTSMTRSGFCAVNSDVPWHLQKVDNFDAIQLRLKLDHRKYTFNVDPQTYLGDDLYQGFLVVPPEKQNKWVTATLPYENFLLTGRGRPKETQRIFDQHVMTGIGLSIQDQDEGDFRLEVQWVRVINSVIFDADSL